MYPAPGWSSSSSGWRGRWSRWSATRRVVMAALAVVVVGSGAVFVWTISSAVEQRVLPSGAKQLALLRRVPHPPGAVEVGHRTQRGRLNSAPSAWLTYQLPGGLQTCRAVIETFRSDGVLETYQKRSDPFAAYCPPSGLSMASYCLPRVVCFSADFGGEPRQEYTLGIGPDSGG